MLTASFKVGQKLCKEYALPAITVLNIKTIGDDLNHREEHLWSADGKDILIDTLKLLEALFSKQHQKIIPYWLGRHGMLCIITPLKSKASMNATRENSANIRGSELAICKYQKRRLLSEELQKLQNLIEQLSMWYSLPAGLLTAT